MTASSQGPCIVILSAWSLWNMTGQTIWTVARARSARQSCGVEMQERRDRAADASRRLDRRGEGRRGRERGTRRKLKTERHSREKAERWWSNLLARQTVLNTAALREICQETMGAYMP